MHNYHFCPRCGSNNISLNEISLKCNDCSLHIFKNNSSAVTALIVHENNILTVKRNHEPSWGMMDLPGGFVDPGESAEDALKREINEELNLKLISSTYIGSHPNNYDFGGITVPCLDLFFKCTIEDFSTLQAGDDAQSFQWINISEINISDFAFSSTRYFLDTILRTKDYLL